MLLYQILSSGKQIMNISPFRKLKNKVCLDLVTQTLFMQLSRSISRVARFLTLQVSLAKPSVFDIQMLSQQYFKV